MSDNAIQDDELKLVDLAPNESAVENAVEVLGKQAAPSAEEVLDDLKTLDRDKLGEILAEMASDEVIEYSRTGVTMELGGDVWYEVKASHIDGRQWDYWLAVDGDSYKGTHMTDARIGGKEPMETAAETDGRGIYMLVVRIDGDNVNATPVEFAIGENSAKPLQDAPNDVDVFYDVVAGDMGELFIQLADRTASSGMGRGEALIQLLTDMQAQPQELIHNMLATFIVEAASISAEGIEDTDENKS